MSTEQERRPVRNKRFAIYDPSGKIVAFTHTNAQMTFDDVDGDLDVLEVENEFVTADDKMVNPRTRRLNKRPVNPAKPNKTAVKADGTDVVRIDVPEGSEVFLDTALGFVSIVAEDRTVELTFDEPGEYTIRIESFPEITKELTINAV